ncbi:hypothetical protein PsorP6_013245 [Peronosclerospora sorghi]|uniref:Uncharacterized protein n=1 Tax=Peronosclerospora sorghi TaxID=230839 RepID=A0ACC0WI46_9STRA|nr:hypothetical protein PsorP6_013245 [Peronosclerospora sorghi]
MPTCVERTARVPRASLDPRFQREDLDEHNEETDGRLWIKWKLVGDAFVRENNDREAIKALGRGFHGFAIVRFSDKGCSSIAPRVLSSSKRWQVLGTRHPTVRSFR